MTAARMPPDRARAMAEVFRVGESAGANAGFDAVSMTEIQSKVTIGFGDDEVVSHSRSSDKPLTRRRLLPTTPNP
jgi:hypothetical protein